MDTINRIYLAISNLKGIGVKTLIQIPYGVISTLSDELDIHAYIQSDNFPLKRKSIKELTIDDVKTALKKAEDTIQNSESHRVSIITVFDAKYPDQFKRLDNYPPIFFAKGNVDALKEDSVAVIGTREPSEIGKKWGTRLSELLTLKGFNIVSGLALGSDSCGHRGSINVGGKTIAVLPCSLEQVYPTSNKNLLEEILGHDGCAISEYPVGAAMNKSNFVERDRLQSGLALGVAVIETGIVGGTWHAINTAIKMNIPVGFLDYGDEHYKLFECSAGNKVGIVERGGIALKDSSSIDAFINRCRNLDCAKADISLDTNVVQGSLF